MTEAEWLACDQPEYLFHVQDATLSVRRRRLIGVAVCRALPPGLIEPSVLERWLARAEQLAEQPVASISADDLPRWNRVVFGPDGRAKQDAREALQQLLRDIVNMAIFHVACARDPSTHPRAVAVDSFLTDIVRDIIGNPFRPTSIAPAWLHWNDSTVVRLAQAIYDERRFADMPILADALEDAGCDNGEILAHCRGTGPHVRGCWVVDRLLGKE